MTTKNMRDHLVGRVLDGRYEIVSRVARGGMATVYLAADRRLTRTVAIKVMHEGLGDDQEFARKFDREARAAARLSHPNIVSVFDQGLDGGRPYIVMEYVEGRTLRNIITTQSPLDPIRALNLLEPLVAAVAAAHEAGLIHRDIKPENVLITDRGRVKVVDFGLAKAITAQTATATQGLLLGTVSYIAPELVTEGRPKPASDVYSIGVVLFEMLTGSKPHTGENPIQVAYSHVHKSVPAPSSVMDSNWMTSRSAIPPYVDALVTSATQREASDRPQDARVLLSHVRAARRALAAGVMNDPALTDRMQLRTLADVEQISPVSPPSVDSASAAMQTTPHSASTPHSSHTKLLTDDASSADSPLSTTREQPAVAVRPPRTKQQIYRRRRIVTLLTVLAVIAAGVGVGGWWMMVGRYTQTPQLVNLTEDAARDLAGQSHVAISFDSQYSETVPTGQIISTDPEAGTQVLRDSNISAFVSKGPERYAVPTLVGLSTEAAKKALTDANLAVGSVTEQYSETVPAGTVIEAGQKAGAQLKKTTKVNLVVSQGPRPIPIANYVGKPLATAKSAWEKAGFTVKVSGEQNSSTVPAGSIVSHSPASGNGKKGDTITVVTSSGPVMVSVPRVRAMSEDKARAALNEAGLKPAVSYLTANPLGLVVSSNPEAGARVAQGSTVTLSVA